MAALQVRWRILHCHRGVPSERHVPTHGSRAALQLACKTTPQAFRGPTGRGTPNVIRGARESKCDPNVKRRVVNVPIVQPRRTCRLIQETLRDSPPSWNLAKPGRGGCVTEPSQQWRSPDLDPCSPSSGMSTSCAVIRCTGVSARRGPSAAPGHDGAFAYPLEPRVGQRRPRWSPAAGTLPSGRKMAIIQAGRDPISRSAR